MPSEDGDEETYGLLCLDAVGLGGHHDLAWLLIDGRHVEPWRESVFIRTPDMVGIIDMGLTFEA